MQFRALLALRMTSFEITITSLTLQNLSFFALGGSNAISSVDLSNSYNGVSGYNVVAVGLLTFVSNWAGPIWWSSATSLLFLNSRKGNAIFSVAFQHLALVSVFVTSSLSFVMIACIILRAHLFIWTVFSPKYLYSIAWSLAHHFLGTVVVASTLLWAAVLE